MRPGLKRCTCPPTIADFWWRPNEAIRSIGCQNRKEFFGEIVPYPGCVQLSEKQLPHRIIDHRCKFRTLCGYSVLVYLGNQFRFQTQEENQFPRRPHRSLADAGIVLPCHIPHQESNRMSSNYRSNWRLHLDRIFYLCDDWSVFWPNFNSSYFDSKRSEDSTKGSLNHDFSFF